MGSNYNGIINNITETKVRVSLSKNCSGFIHKKDIPDTQNFKVGSVLRVKFIQMS
ncbi:MAG: S1 RNA-binding domain-containing protein [bacterium]